MQKTITIQQLKLGMYIHEIKGSWIENPFWKKSFLLEKAEALALFKTYGIQQVIIDTRKGLDISRPISTSTEPLPVVEILAKKPVSNTFAQESEKAKQIIKNSKRTIGAMFHQVRLGKKLNATEAMPVVDAISASLGRNAYALTSLMRLKHPDDYYYMHAVAVSALMMALASELKLDEALIQKAGLAGLLHDIGKSEIPLEIINKPDKLTDTEFEQIKKHPELGHALLLNAGIDDELILDVCLHHHEKMDGSGFPHQLNGDEVSLLGKMCAVCDIYDALTSNRPYKAGWQPSISIKRMALWTNHFDPVVFEAFVKIIGIYPIGSMVLLKSGRLAVVVDQNAKSLLKPIVKVFFSTKSKVRLPVELIDLSRSGLNDEITGHEDPATWGITDINELWAIS